MNDLKTIKSYSLYVKEVNMKIKISDNKELKKEIRDKLSENKEKYGKQFCPHISLSLYEKENNDDYVCMCKEFRDQIERKENGKCKCGLYTVIND